MLMFPPSLHQNIRELDKQISLLENECENMKSFKEKKVNNGKPPSNKTSKASNSYLKSPPVKETSNKPFVTGPPRSISAGSSRKLTVPPVMSKWSSASSVPCKDRCRRSCSGSVESPVTEIGLQKTKSNRSQTNLRNSEKEKVNLIKGKCVCPCSKPRSVSLADSKQVSKNQNDDLENHLLHKEVLYTNPGSTIEVTVTQKSSKSQNESNGHPPKRSIGLIKEISETISDKSNGCSCGKGDGKEVNRIIENDISSNGQKWCEILSDRDYGKNEKKKNLMGDLNGTKKNNDELLSKLQCYYVKTNSETSSKYIDNNGAIRPRSPNFSSMKENTYVAVSRDCNKCKEQAVQCSLWDLDPVKYGVPLDLYNPIRILHFSLNQLKKKEVDEDTKNLIGEMENAMQKICSERIKPTYNSCFQPSNRIKSDNKDDLTEKENNGYINYLQTNYITAKSLCDKLTAEKEQMSKELADKDRRLADMINDEKKYLSLISSLKNNLEKSKGEAEESVRLVKELNILKNKLFDETKVADALRKSHAKMQERVQKYLLENDKLKTQIRMHKLEARKFDLLLAGKDVEINRYKEEMESFKKMISEELAILRSNAAMNEVEKAMEAIMHHSLFSQTDLESIRSESQIEKKPKSSSTKTREKLMHSSPSSTKASILDSSWNQISSIHGDELPDKDSVILTPLKSPKIKLSLNVSKKSNGFLETGPSKRSPEVHQIQKDVLEQKKEPSFTSCKSVIDLDGSEIAQNLDGSESDEDGPTLCHDSGVDTTKNQPQLSLKNTEKIKSNIEDLFNDWRLKLKEKISSAQNNMNFENFFDDCPLSDLSQGSDDLSITLSEIESQTDGRN